MEKAGEGFVISNKLRKAVFIEIATGENSIERITKKHHLLKKLVENAIADLTQGELVNKKNGEYGLTDHGKKIFAKIKSSDAI
jgi:predicted transcriptional regulator